MPKDQCYVWVQNVLFLCDTRQNESLTQRLAREHQEEDSTSAAKTSDEQLEAACDREHRPTDRPTDWAPPLMMRKSSSQTTIAMRIVYMLVNWITV
jgi:hypothetical protein